MTTALLIVTDQRWRNATGRLIRQIDESGLISPDDLDILAQTFLAADRHVYWEIPGEWFDGPATAIGLGPQPVDDDPDDDGEEAPDTSGLARSLSVERFGHRSGAGLPVASFAPTPPCRARSSSEPARWTHEAVPPSFAEFWTVSTRSPRQPAPRSSSWPPFGHSKASARQLPSSLLARPPTMHRPRRRLHDETGISDQETDELRNPAPPSPPCSEVPISVRRLAKPTGMPRNAVGAPIGGSVRRSRGCALSRPAATDRRLGRGHCLRLRRWRGIHARDDLAMGTYEDRNS